MNKTINDNTTSKQKNLCQKMRPSLFVSSIADENSIGLFKMNYM